MTSKSKFKFQMSSVIKVLFIVFILFTSSLYAGGLKYIESNIRISPRNNVFDKSNPRDLAFVVHHPKTSLKGIFNKDKAVEYREFSFVDIIVDNENLDLPFTSKIEISKNFLNGLNKGKHVLEFRFSNNETRKFSVEIEDQKSEYKLQITDINVGHGVAVLIQLPDQTILLDTGKKEWANTRLIPLLKKHGVTTIDHLIITHWHDDHFGGLDAIDSAFTVKEILYNLCPEGEKESGKIHNPIFSVGNEFSFGDAHFKVLNAAKFDENKYPAYKAENFDGYVGKNNRSLSFNMEYNGFIYSHGGDIYQHAQKAILQTFGEESVKAHIYHANHHFHGGVSVDYLKKVDPYLFITPANPAVYNRDAYVKQVMGKVIPYLEKNSHRFIENLFDFEVGNITISVNDSSDWRYETEYLNDAKLIER